MMKEDWIKEWNANRFNESGECVGSISKLFTENQNLREVRKSELQLYRKLEVENKRLREALEKISDVCSWRKYNDVWYLGDKPLYKVAFDALNGDEND